MFKGKELACIRYNLLERVPAIEASSLDSSRDGTLFAAGVSKRVQVRRVYYVIIYIATSYFLCVLCMCESTFW